MSVGAPVTRLSISPDQVPAAQERILSWVTKDESGCWIWEGYHGARGYGTTHFDGYNWYAHRLSYAAFTGPIQDGHSICHSCDTPPCVNPSHLFQGTHSENMADMAAKGRTKKPGDPRLPRGDNHYSRANPEYFAATHNGERNGFARLTRDRVFEMRERRRQGASLNTLVEEFGMSKSQTYRIVTRQSWAWL